MKPRKKGNFPRPTSTSSPAMAYVSLKPMPARRSARLLELACSPASIQATPPCAATSKCVRKANFLYPPAFPTFSHCSAKPVMSPEPSANGDLGRPGLQETRRVKAWTSFLATTANCSPTTTIRTTFGTTPPVSRCPKTTMALTALTPKTLSNNKR